MEHAASSYRNILDTWKYPVEACRYQVLTFGEGVFLYGPIGLPKPLTQKVMHTHHVSDGRYRGGNIP